MEGERVHVVVRLEEPLWREVGAREVSLDLPEGSHVSDLLRQLTRAFPALRPWLEGEEVPPLIFLDEAVAAPDTALRDGARPTLAWPLAGG